MYGSGLGSSVERLRDSVGVMVATSLESLGVSLPDDEVDNLTEESAGLVQRILGQNSSLIPFRLHLDRLPRF